MPSGEKTPSHYVGCFIILSPSRSPRGEGYSPFQVGESIQMGNLINLLNRSYKELVFSTYRFAVIKQIYQMRKSGRDTSAINY